MNRRINAYRCPICMNLTVTIDRDEGVTPMFLNCRVTPGCKGMAESYFYRPPKNAGEPTHEWYRPEAEEMRTLEEGMLDHVRRGGLCIRAITGEVLKS